MFTDTGEGQPLHGADTVVGVRTARCKEAVALERGIGMQGGPQGTGGSSYSCGQGLREGERKTAEERRIQ